MSNLPKSVRRLQLIINGAELRSGLVQFGQNVSGRVELELIGGTSITSIYLVSRDESIEETVIQNEDSLVKERYARIQLFGKFERHFEAGIYTFPFVFELGRKCGSSNNISKKELFSNIRGTSYSLTAAMKIGQNPAIFADTLFDQAVVPSLSPELITYAFHTTDVKKRLKKCGHLSVRCLVSCCDKGKISFTVNCVNNSVHDFGRLYAELNLIPNSDNKENCGTPTQSHKPVIINAYNWPHQGPLVAAKKLVTWTLEGVNIPQTLNDASVLVLDLRTEKGKCLTVDVPRVAYVC